MGEINRIENESDFAYKYRLIINKSLKEFPYSDLEWEDVRELLQTDQHRDTLRKRGDAWKELIEHIDEIELPSHKETNDTEEFIKLKKEKVKLQDIRNCTQKNIRQLAKLENILELIINDCKNIPNFKLIDVDKVAMYPSGSKANLLVSDIHYDGSELPISNFNKLIDTTINKCKLHNINQLNVMLAGDLINNELKTTIRLENQEDVSKQLVNVSKLISDGLYKLAKNVPMVTVAICSGNHERRFEDYKKALTTDTYLPIIKELIELRLNDLHNVVILDNAIVDGEVDDRFCIMNIDGKTHVVTHGNGLKNLENSAIRVVEGYLGNGIKIDYLYLGHFHSEKSFQTFDSNVIVNGALCNKSDYGKKLLLRTPPIQKLMILNEGDVECTYNIKL